MADAFTKNFDWVLPEVGASRDTWGTKENSVIVLIDQLCAAIMPPGMVADYAGGSIPVGWLLCDGRPVSRTTYAQLFAAIGTTYGVGDGSTTFNLPNTAGRVSVGAGTNGSTSFARGALGGAYAVTIAQTHLPNYTLPSSVDGVHTHTGATDASGVHTHSGSTDTVGNHSHTFPCMDVQSVIDGGQFATLPGGGSHPVDTYGAGSHSHGVNIPSGGAHSHGISTYDGQGSHSHTITLGGGGTALPTQDPYFVATKIIWCGVLPPASAVTSLPSRVASDVERGGAI